MELCQLILVGFCMLGAPKFETSSTNDGQHAVITRNDAKIEIDVPNEMNPTPDWKQMQFACRQPSCVSYYKHCDLRKSVAICDYWFTDWIDVKFRHIRVSADSISALSEAEWAVRVQTKSGKTVNDLPLSELKVLGPNSAPPFCGKEKTPSECLPTAREVERCLASGDCPVQR